MISGFLEWATAERLVQSSPVEQFKDRCIAIDADHFINRLLTDAKTREPLLAALGGVPYKLEELITTQAKHFKDAGIKPFFVFSGLVVSGEQRKVDAAKETLKKINEAWDFYNSVQTDSAVIEFGKVTGYETDHILRHVQSIFHQQRIPFLVAPYGAHAQMVSMLGELVDAVLGPSELLLYSADRILLEIDWDKQTVSWVNRQNCISALCHGNVDHWIDSCLLAGSDLLPTLPHLDTVTPVDARPPKIKAAADHLRRVNLNANQLLVQYGDDPLLQGLDYLDSFRRANMTIEHHVITAEDGAIFTLHADTAPFDVHAFMGQRLPEEIYYYISRGVIGTRVLGWRTTGQIVEKPPVDGGASVTYEVLVHTQIVPQRVKALRILSQSLHRFYQHRDVTLKLFFGTGEPKSLSVNEAGDIKRSVAGWQVRQPVIADKMKDVKVDDCSLYFAVEALASSDFAKSTVLTKEALAEVKPLKDAYEIQSNALWTYLQLHEYITPSHELSPLGKALQTSYTTARSAGLSPAQYGEPLLLGIELLRLKLLNFDTLFPVPPYHGAPYRGTETDQRHALLLSRIACLGRLDHKVIGYTGPLSRHIVAFRSVVSVIRRSQRDLLDMSLLTLLLDGKIDRLIPEHELKNVGFGLPFLRDVECALSLTVKHYLDELAGSPDPTSDATRRATKDKCIGTWFPHAVNLKASLEYAFTLFDALAAAVKILPDEVVSAAAKKEWEGVEEWLRDRR